MTNKSSNLVRLSIAVFLLVGLLSLGWARDAPPSSHRSAIVLKLALPEGNSVQVTEQDGGTIRLERADGQFAITPRIVDRNAGTIELQFFKITQTGKLASPQTVGHLQAQVGSTIQTGQAGFALTINTVKILSQGPQSAARCCLLCGGTFVCADCVICMGHACSNCPKEP